MKKFILHLLPLAALFLGSCEKSNVNDEILEIELTSTDKDDSVNTGGGGNEKPDNSEE